jgi:hypothetical protein
MISFVYLRVLSGSSFALFLDFISNAAICEL